MTRARQLLVVIALSVGIMAFSLFGTLGVIWLDVYARPAVKAWLGGF